jgi:two-component sensor histidine kinase
MAVDDRTDPASAGDGPSLIIVPHHPHGARVARQRLAAELATLPETLSPAVVADVVAVGAELLGNAVRHARPLPGGVIHLSWGLGGSGATSHVVLRVVDGGSAHTPTRRFADPDAIDGRGLAIVAALAVRWGVDKDGTRQCVWAEVAAALP